jgi:hypothetical protein
MVRGRAPPGIWGWEKEGRRMVAGVRGERGGAAACVAAERRARSAARRGAACTPPPPAVQRTSSTFSCTLTRCQSTNTLSSRSRDQMFLAGGTKVGWRRGR